MGVEIANRQCRLPLNSKEIAALVDATLVWEDTAGTVGIAYVGRSRIIELNKRYFGKEETTDVIAFPLRDEVHEASDHLGEIAVCADVAADEAEARGLDVYDELYFYTVHGLLHILGYTDENEEKRTTMNDRARAILQAFYRKHARPGPSGER
jgi:probable rRNA maturation factor